MVVVIIIITYLSFLEYLNNTFYFLYIFLSLHCVCVCVCVCVCSSMGLQRVARRHMKPFLNEQYKEIEENNRM